MLCYSLERVIIAGIIWGNFLISEFRRDNPLKTKEK